LHVTARAAVSVCTVDAPLRREASMTGRALVVEILVLGAVLGARASGIEGTWRSAAGTVDVRIAKCGPALCGTIARVVSEHSMADPSVSMADAPGVGIVVLSNFLPSEGASDSGPFEGYLYDRETRKMYACVMSLEAPDRLRIHPYVGVQLLGQSQTWMRVSE
jgi:uncharacterized protein (DUF2147 family)